MRTCPLRAFVHTCVHSCVHAFLHVVHCAPYACCTLCIACCMLCTVCTVHMFIVNCEGMSLGFSCMFPHVRTACPLGVCVRSAFCFGCLWCVCSACVQVRLVGVNVCVCVYIYTCLRVVHLSAFMHLCACACIHASVSGAHILALCVSCMLYVLFACVRWICLCAVYVLCVPTCAYANLQARRQVLQEHRLRAAGGGREGPEPGELRGAQHVRHRPSRFQTSRNSCGARLQRRGWWRLCGWAVKLVRGAAW